MKPVFQTISNAVNGNCLAAIVASLLEQSIEEVPNFVEAKDWFVVMQEYMFKFGYEYDQYLMNHNRPELSADAKTKYDGFPEQLPEYGSINGFFDAVVYSKNFPGEHHAVICDKDFNIVHDPSTIENSDKYPRSDEVGYNGIVGVCLWRKL